MLWVEKLKKNVREILAEHPVSICLFLLGSIGLGVYQDIADNDFVTFFYQFMFSLSPCFVLLESGFDRIREKKILKMISAAFALICAVLCFAWTYMYAFKHSEAVLQGGELYSVYTYLTRVFIVYICFSALGSVNLMYRKSELSFETYCIRGFLGVMKAGFLYGVVAAGTFTILMVYDVLIHEVDIMTLAQMIVVGVVGFPGLLIGLSRVSGEITKFSRIVFGYVLPAILAVACIIVYIYIIKIIVIRSFPSNEAFSIMTSIFATGLFIWTAAQGCTEEPVVRYLKLFPFVFAPFIVVQIICLSMRIGQYGVTGSRYLGILLIIFEIVYVGIYALQMKRGTGIQGCLFPMLLAVALVYYLIPGINVYASVTRSQKAIVDKYLSEVSAGGSSAISLARARSAMRAIRDEGSLEGMSFAKGLKSRYSQELIAKIDGSDTTDYDHDEFGNTYTYISAYNSEPLVDVKDYSYMKTVAVNMDSGDIDPKNIPVYENYNINKTLAYVDLSEVLSALKELDIKGAGEDEKQAVIDSSIILDANSALYIYSLDFKSSEDGTLTSISFSGYYLYRYK